MWVLQFSFLIKVDGSDDSINILMDSLEFDRVSGTYNVEEVYAESCYEYDGEMYNGSGKRVHDEEFSKGVLDDES